MHESLAKVSSTVCGPLFESLASKAGVSHEVAGVFRKGAPLFDNDAGTLWWECEASNSELIASLREGAHSTALHELTMADARLGRMTLPVPADRVDLSNVRLVPRFAVEQGTRPDGSAKLRPIDNFSWSHQGAARRKRKRSEVKEQSINGQFTQADKIKHDHLDELLGAMRVHHDEVGQVCIYCAWRCFSGRGSNGGRYRRYGRQTLTRPSAGCQCAPTTRALPHCMHAVFHSCSVCGCRCKVGDWSRLLGKQCADGVDTPGNALRSNRQRHCMAPSWRRAVADSTEVFAHAGVPVRRRLFLCRKVRRLLSVCVCDGSTGGYCVDQKQ